MKILSILLCLSAASLHANEPVVIDSGHNSYTASVETVKGIAEMEFNDGNFGNASFLCEYLEKRGVDDQKFKLIWAASQNRIGNWTKAEKLYVGVVNHKRASKKQKSLACVYLAKQQTELTSKENYADMAVSYSKSDFVMEMVGQIYKDLEIDAIGRGDTVKAEYYKHKYEEFIKSSVVKYHETPVGKF